MKSYVVLWLFIYFLISSNLEHMLVFFLASLTFNLAVVTILMIGLIMVIKAAVNLVMLAGTFGILAYKKDNLEFYLKDLNKLMPANIAHMFNARAKSGMLMFTVEEAKSVTEWIEEKFSNQNKYTTYFTGTVLMIGLLGTFAGLLVAIDDMGRIILSLSGDIDLAKVIADFSGPLGGMAVGFGSSLFGVIAAIVLGLHGYILNKNQEQFIEGVEDWLKGRIIDSAGTVTDADGNALPETNSSFMDVFIDNLSTLSKEMGNISQTNERLTSITVASVQQARNEHELSIELFEDISKSLKNIDSNSKDTTKILGQEFNSLQISMNTNHTQLITHQQDSLQQMINKLESALESTSFKITNEFKSISSSSNNEMDLRVNKITTLLQAIDSELGTHQKVLLDIQNSDDKNQSSNEKLLQELITLFKDSSDKLDSEQKLLSDIYKHLDDNSDNSQEHFNGISQLIKSFSSTLQDELKSLDLLQEIQNNQSLIIKESIDKSNDIHQTLKESNEQNDKQQEHLEAITTKIESVKEQMLQSSNKSSTMLEDSLAPLMEISKTSSHQEANLVELLNLNKQDAINQQENLNKIYSQIDLVKEEFLGVNEKELESNKENFEKLINQNEKELESNKENFEKLISQNEKELESNKENFDNLVSKIDKNNEENLQNSEEGLEKLTGKLDDVTESLTQAIVNNKSTSSSNDDKKSGGFFNKMFN